MVERNTYYDDSSASHLEGEQTIELTNEMNTDSSIPNANSNRNRTQAKEDEQRSKHIRKPSKCVVDLLEGAVCGQTNLLTP